MSIINHLNDTSLEQELVTCPKCHKLFKCMESEQTPGFRDKDYLCCPYCGNVLRSSMEYEFFCSKLTDEEIRYLQNKGITVYQEEIDDDQT